jgi:hypothetical protein
MAGLDDHDRYRIAQARDALAKAQQLDMSDDRAMARTIGLLEVALSQLLDVIDALTEEAS